jgi:TATA-binding protein-associated factor Taf7
MPKETDDRTELERRLEQARRMANGAGDPITRERLINLARELEAQLKSQ